MAINNRYFVTDGGGQKVIPGRRPSSGNTGSTVPKLTSAGNSNANTGYNVLQGFRDNVLSNYNNKTPQTGVDDSNEEKSKIDDLNRGSSYSTSVSYNPYSGYADQLRALYEQQQQNLASYQQAQREAAQNAYNSNMAALQAAYNAKITNLDKSLSNAKDQLLSQYDYSKQGINSDASRALQEAYVNKMLSQKNMQQQLTAQGLSGGASESSMAGLINNYGNARNEIDLARNDNLSSLEQTYNSNLADVLQNYYNAKIAADESRLGYQMQFENALANNAVSSYGDLHNAMANLDSSYLSAMQNALANQAAYNAKTVTASNRTDSVNTESDLSSFNNAVQYIKKTYGANNEEDLIRELNNAGYSSEQISQIFAKAGF